LPIIVDNAGFSGGFHYESQEISADLTMIPGSAVALGATPVAFSTSSIEAYFINDK
jgi:hypothetical protein